MTDARVCLLVRSDHRGIGSQTQDLARWLKPAKTLLIRMGRWTSAVEHPDRWPDARQVAFDGITGRLDDDAIEWALTDVDVVVAVETPMDFRLWARARDAGVATVVIANPEFYRHTLEPLLPEPDLVVAPSPWRLAHMPGAVYCQQPVDRERFKFRPRPEVDHVRFVHVIGRQAIWDRAGTDLLLTALRQVTDPVDITIRSQGPLSAAQRLAWQRLRPQVRPRMLTGDVDDAATLYDEADVLIAPRRYGGLSLPLMEARSMGLAVIAADRVPESGWLPPECLVPASRARQGRFQGGMIDLEDARIEHLAAKINEFSRDLDLVAEMSKRSDAWAETVSWPQRLGEWEALIEAAARGQLRDLHAAVAR